MPRVVLDTNIVVSALLVPAGQEALLLLLVLQGALELFISPPLLAEYEEVLRRPRLKLHPQEVETVLGNIRAAGFLVHPTTKVTLSRHESDNRIYECAIAAKAAYIVTGNRKHFPEDYGGGRVVSARELLNQLH
jgi:putative PIN family toxin of toxin-antitoxin system